MVLVPVVLTESVPETVVERMVAGTMEFSRSIESAVVERVRGRFSSRILGSTEMLTTACGINQEAARAEEARKIRKMAMITLSLNFDLSEFYYNHESANPYNLTINLKKT